MRKLAYNSKVLKDGWLRCCDQSTKIKGSKDEGPVSGCSEMK